MNLTLTVVQGRPEGKRMTFPPGEYYIGRGLECHIRPNSEWVSRQHCVLRVTAEGALVRDLASRNGTLVNGMLLMPEKELVQGDVLELGPLAFRVQLEAGAVPAGTAMSPHDSVIVTPAGGISMVPVSTSESTVHAATLPLSKEQPSNHGL